MGLGCCRDGDASLEPWVMGLGDSGLCCEP